MALTPDKWLPFVLLAVPVFLVLYGLASLGEPITQSHGHIKSCARMSGGRSTNRYYFCEVALTTGTVVTATASFLPRGEVDLAIEQTPFGTVRYMVKSQFSQ